MLGSHFTMGPPQTELSQPQPPLERTGLTLQETGANADAAMLSHEQGEAMGALHGSYDSVKSNTGS